MQKSKIAFMFLPDKNLILVHTDVTTQRIHFIKVENYSKVQRSV